MDIAAYLILILTFTTVTGTITTLIWMLFGCLYRRVRHAAMGYYTIWGVIASWLVPVTAIALYAAAHRQLNGTGAALVTTPLLRWGSVALVLAYLVKAALRFRNFHLDILDRDAESCFMSDCTPEETRAFHHACIELQMEAEHFQLNKSSRTFSPCIIGYKKPIICLPADPKFAKKIGEKHLRAIFLHELTHHRQKDQLVRYILRVIGCIHFFNPLVGRLLAWEEIASENACDDVVCRYTDRLIYTEALLFAGSREEAAMHLWSNLIDSRKLLKMRIGSICNSRRKTFWTRGLATLLTVLMVSLDLVSVTAATVALERGYSLIQNLTNIEKEDLPQNVSLKEYTKKYDLTDYSEDGNFSVEDYGKTMPRNSSQNHTFSLSSKGIKFTKCFCSDKKQIQVGGILQHGSNVLIGIVSSDDEWRYIKADGVFVHEFPIDRESEYRLFVINEGDEEAELELTAYLSE